MRSLIDKLKEKGRIVLVAGRSLGLAILISGCTLSPYGRSVLRQAGETAVMSGVSTAVSESIKKEMGHGDYRRERERRATYNKVDGDVNSPENVAGRRLAFIFHDYFDRVTDPKIKEDVLNIYCDDGLNVKEKEATLKKYFNEHPLD